MGNRVLSCVSGLNFASSQCQRLYDPVFCVSVIDTILSRYSSSLRPLMSYVRGLSVWDRSLSDEERLRVCRLVSDLLQSYDLSALNSYSLIPCSAYAGLGESIDVSDFGACGCGGSVAVLVHRDCRMLLTGRDVVVLNKSHIVLSIDIGHWLLWCCLLLVAFGIHVID